MTLLTFPTTGEISHVVRNRIVDPKRFLGRSFCPIKPVYAAKIEFDVIEAAQGMTAAHNIGSDPKMAVLAGMKTKKIGTGYFKETKRIDEKELLYARQAGSFNERAGRSIVMEKALQLDDRLETRIEWLIWQPLTEGQITIEENGVKLLVPYDLPDSNKPVLGENGTLKWTDPEADIPSDIMKWMLLFRGTGARATKAYFNLAVAALIASNKHIKELLSNSNYAKLLSAANVSEALKLLYPQIDFIVYDEGYGNEQGIFNTFVPDDRFLMIGEGQATEIMMDFGSTISLHNGGLDNPQPGKFSVVDNKSEIEKNPYIDITVGIYGLPRLYHPNWVVSAKIK